MMIAIRYACMAMATLLVTACEPAPTIDQTADAAALAANPTASTDVAAAPAGSSANEDGPHEWYAANIDFTRCHRARAPAERIQTIKDGGYDPVINEGTAADGAMTVEVGAPNPGGLSTTYVTYYRSLAGCEQALQEENSVPAKYQ